MNKRSGGGGYLYNRLRYLRVKDKSKHVVQTVVETDELASSEENQIVASSSQDATDDDIATSESYQMDDLLYLKTAHVNEQNIRKYSKLFRRR